MKVLGISASPRRGGNTEILLDRALEGAASRGAATEKVILNELRYKPCQECGGCSSTGVCVIHDDMRLIYAKLSNADAIIVSSPIFFGTISAQLKAMIDRHQCSWISKYVLKKCSLSRKMRKGAFLCVGGSGVRKFFEHAKKIVRIFFATLDIAYTHELFYPGIDDKGGILKNKKALDEAYEIGRGIVG